MKQQQQQQLQHHYHQINVSDDNNLNNNKFSVNKNRNSLPVYSINSTNCYLCMRNLPASPSLIMIVNDHYYHRDCFKCSKCDKYLNENEAHTLIEHKYLYCGNCFIKRKPLQSKSQIDSNQQKTTVSLSNTNNNNLNELKLKFESVQKNNTLNSLKYSNLNKINNPTTTTTSITNNSNNDFYMTNNNYQTVGLSFSSSSSSSNFSLSPSSSSSWSSSNNSSITNSIQNNNGVSQINQRITMLNNISLQNQRINNENICKTKRLTTNINNLEISPKSVNQNQNDRNETISLPMTPVLNLKRNDSKKAIFSSNQNSPKTANNTFKDINFYSPPIESDNKTVKSSNNITQVKNTDSNLLPFKQHTSKCNIILRKTRRGNKRSKSLPSKFNVDSLLDYLNCSMLINKYELKKLNHQRNMLLSTNSNNNILIYNSKNRYKQLLNYNNNYYKNQQFSSGYNSENYSNSSNSITNGVTTICASNSFLTNKNMINFYRLSLSHLPLHFLNLQCTCGASNFNNSIDISRLNDALQSSSSSSSIGCFRHSNIENLKSSSPNNKFEEFDVDYDEDEDDDEDEDEDDEEDLDEELNQNTSIDENILNQTATNLNQIETILNNNNKSLEVKKINEANDIRFQFNNCLQRAPGTSHCQHTVRVDIRRVRSLINLSHLQYIYSPNDFIFKEKLGEGFFANVKKIISKQTNKTMVLKELKLSCISSMNNNNSNAYNENLSSSIHSESDSKLDESLNSLARGDFLINYAELNAAYKSFLKEAQVLRNLNHPNVIKLMGIMFTKEKHLNLILEYISGGTLKDIIHNISNILPWKLRVGYAKDIAAAMEYLHSLNIIHRDLKSDNCLVRENGRTVVVADFGLSRINTIQASDNNPTRSIKNRNDSFNLSLFRLPNSYLTSNNNSYVQSPQSSSSATNSFIVAAKRKLKRHNHTRKPRYAVVGNSFSMAPEMLNHQIYDERVDIFSFGIICCEIIGRVQADPDYLPRTSDFGLNVELFRKKYCEADCPKHFIKIAIACCELEPDKRPPFTKTHLWLETILSHLETNNPIPKNLLKNILDQNTKRPLSSLIHSNNENQQLLTNQSKN